MAGAKEIRVKIGSVKNTQKITKAMEMVAASKMRKAQDRMQAARPYARRIRQVLWKLISNAAKFTEGGRVTLTASRVDGDLELSVADTGIGMSPDELRVVFEAFRQIDDSSTRRHEGGGLGLAVARRMCRAMGARIEVESQPGRGSVFRVRVPPVGGAQANQPASAPAPKIANTKPTESST